MIWEVGVLAALGALVVVAALSVWTPRSAPRDELARVAEALGLDVTPRGLEGTVDGVELLAEPPTRQRGWRARARPALPWPDGVHLSSEEGRGQPLSVDDEVVVHVEGPWPDLSRLVGDLRVAGPLAAAVEAAVKVEIGDAVRVVVKGEGAASADAAVRAALGVALGLNAAMAAYQREAGAPEGVEVGDLRPGEGTWELPLAADLPPVLPPKTEIRSGAAWGAGQPIGDVVADAALRMRTADPDALREVLSREGVRERLIALVGEHRDSVVETGRLSVVITDGALDPAARVAELVALLDRLAS